MSDFGGLDPKVWWRTAVLAEREGLTVRQFLARPVAEVPRSLEVLAAELEAARAEGVSLGDRWWCGEQKRRQNLESFRHMKVEWIDD